MVTTAGRLMPGYMPALQLASALGVTVDPQLAAELQKKQDAQAQQ
jgi:thiol:disulfide interchange protein DsbC